jgi:ABC-type dipeptide/oligopeptide/nickel transport system permease subunit
MRYDSRIFHWQTIFVDMASHLIMLTAYFAKAILLKAMLSCLRLGVTGPTPARGLMPECFLRARD